MSDYSSDSEDEDFLFLLMAFVASMEQDDNILMLLLLLLRRRGIGIDSNDSDEDEEENHSIMDESSQLGSTVSHNTVPEVSHCENLTTERNILQGTNLTRTNATAQQANSTQKLGLNVSKTNLRPQQSLLKTKQTTAQHSNMTISKPMPQHGLHTHGRNFPTRRQEPQVSNLTVHNVAVHNAKLLPHKMPSSCANHATFTQNSSMSTLNVQSLNTSTMKLPGGGNNLSVPKVTVTGAHLPIHGHFGRRQPKPKPSSASKSYGTAGSSKRPGSDPEDRGKKQKGKPTKKMRTDKDNETESDVPEGCLEDPFEMIEIEEPRIKEEIFETEEFNEVKCEDITINDESIQEKGHFETVFCTPGIIKEERQDDIEMPIGYDATETDTTVPEFMQTEIKSEPPEEEKEDDEDEEGETELRAAAPLMWRCPLISCPEMFSTELEMYQHLNLNHVVKGLALSSKSKKVSAPRPVTTSPSVAISRASGLVFLTSSSSSPRLSPVLVPSSQSVPSSSCGPVTVTTTLSYSSLTTSSSPLVTSSSISSVSCATLISSASPSVTVPSGSTLCPPASSTVVLSTPTPDVSGSPSVGSTNLNSLTFHSANPPPVTTSSQGPQKFIVAPISGLDSTSTGPKKFLLLAPQQPKQKPAVTTPKAKPVQIFHPSGHSTEDLPPCATDDSEMFSISLAQFPQNIRVPIKRKFIDVVDCVKHKNISPDKVLIAFYENSSDSRTM